MTNYKLEIYIDKKNGVGIHEKADPLTVNDARLILSVLEEYKGRLLAYITFTQNLNEKELKQEAKKVE